MQVAHRQNTTGHIRFLGGVGLMEHALVPVTGGAGLVGVNAGDQQQLVLYLLLHRAQAVDIFQHRVLAVGRTGPDDQNQAVIFTGKDFLDLLIALGLFLLQVRAQGKLRFNLLRRGQFAVPLHGLFHVFSSPHSPVHTRSYRIIESSAAVCGKIYFSTRKMESKEDTTRILSLSGRRMRACLKCWSVGVNDLFRTSAGTKQSGNTESGWQRPESSKSGAKPSAWDPDANSGPRWAAGTPVPLP